MFSLSEMMSTSISKDERNFENINDRYRPTVMCDEFNKLCSYQWLDIKSQLDNRGVGEEISCKALCVVLVVSCIFFEGTGFINDLVGFY